MVEVESDNYYYRAEDSRGKAIVSGDAQFCTVPDDAFDMLYDDDDCSNGGEKADYRLIDMTDREGGLVIVE